MGIIWLERNRRTVRKVEKSGEKVWEVAKFNASLRTLITRSICNYGLGLFVIMVLVLMIFLIEVPFCIKCRTPVSLRLVLRMRL